VHIEETLVIARSAQVVFDYLTNPANLASWQTSITSVEQLTDGRPGLGSRFRETTKPPLGKPFEQVVEFTEFDRPRRLRAHVVEGPYPIDGTWSLEALGDGTRVTFTAEGELSGLMKLLGPLASRVLARQFAQYHRNLRRNVEGV
jgi:uncharacterized protein YndB with AHSA1/START domain